jgi:predicted ATPase/DNA-binding CsgD family transcriptional regulator
MLVSHTTDRPDRLPAETTEFVGRVAELCRIEALLRENRLVTLVGPGGVGKTRLALRAAARAAADYPDGSCLVELSALRDPELLPHTVAGRLGLPEQSPGSQLDMVLARLSDRHSLLILDTCEHLIDACALFVEAIISGAPSVTVLVTSREPLAAGGESCYTVPPLGLPGLPGRGSGGHDAGDLDNGQGAADAIELFALRAAAAVPGFEVTDANRADVIRLCRQLDGIPLAIELAAVGLATLSPAELADRLERRPDYRLALLTSGRRGDNGRHRTLRNAIGWSYDLCTSAERALWARLSVFAGAFDLTAAEEVCASSDLSRDQIFDTILRLIDKSVLLHEEPGGGAVVDDDHPMRLRMLDTVREFGAEQLAASGAETAIRNRLIARYLSMARYFRDHLVEDGQLARFRQLRREHDNIRAALEYTLGAQPAQHERVQDGAELASALYGYWISAGLMLEGAYWLGRTLDRFTEPGTHRAWALTLRCCIRSIQGDTAGAIADGRESLRLAASLDDPLLTGRGYVNLCLPLAMSGQVDEAARVGEQARQLLTPHTDRVGLIMLEIHLGFLSYIVGQPDRVIECYHRGLALLGGSGLGDLGEAWLHGYLHVMAAFAFFQQPGRDGECARTLQRALVAKHELGEITGTAYALEVLGWVAARTGHHRRAAWLLGAADPLWERCGTRLSSTESLEELRKQLMAASRAALGEQPFDTLFASGARAPLEDMVALAITSAEEPGARTPAIPIAGTLTDREREIAFLAASGMRTDKIAESLFISRHAVADHLDRVHAKLGVSSARQLREWFKAHLV